MTANMYVNQIVKKIKCSGKKRKEIRRQLLADLEIDLQNGETMAAVMLRMGEPIVIAEEFNQNLPDRERKLYKRGILLKTTGCIAAVLVLLICAVLWFLPKTAQIEKSGIFQAEALEERSREVIRLLDAQDYEALKKMSIDEIKAVLNKDSIDQARASVSSDWGDFIEFGKFYMQEYTQMGKTLALVQINTAYKNTSVTYTILFDKSMKIAGLYMK